MRRITKKNFSKKELKELKKLKRFSRGNVNITWSLETEAYAIRENELFFNFN